MVSYSDTKLLETLISIDTQNPCASYNKILEFLEEYFSGKGADIEHLGKNLIIIFGKPKLLLNAHMDTVKATGWGSDPLKAKIENDRILGLGACDTKGNIYCIMKAIEPKPKNLMILFSVDEEHGAKPGSYDFTKTKHMKNIEKAIVMEPTENKVIVKHPGYYEVCLTFTTKAAHSSVSAKNAICLAAESIIKIKKYYENRFNIGAISSSSDSACIVANECRMKISIRTYDSYPTVLDRLKTLLPPDTTIEPAQIGPPFYNHSPFLTGGEASFWSEAAILSTHGINTIVYGAGSIQQAHQPDEYVSVESLDKCISFLKEIMEGQK